MTDSGTVLGRAHEVARDRLLRERALLHAVTPDERAAIEDTAYAIAARVAECLLEEARRCPPFAAVLIAGLSSAESDSRQRVRRSRRSAARVASPGASTMAMRLPPFASRGPKS
jgi:hypothetical protein